MRTELLLGPATEAPQGGPQTSFAGLQTNYLPTMLLRGALGVSGLTWAPRARPSGPHPALGSQHLCALAVAQTRLGSPSPCSLALHFRTELTPKPRGSWGCGTLVFILMTAQKKFLPVAQLAEVASRESCWNEDTPEHGAGVPPAIAEGFLGRLHQLWIAAGFPDPGVQEGSRRHLKRFKEEEELSREVSVGNRLVWGVFWAV